MCLFVKDKCVFVCERQMCVLKDKCVFVKRQMWVLKGKCVFICKRQMCVC